MISTYHKNGGRFPGVMKSPLYNVEDTIVEFDLQWAIVQLPFDQKELIDFTNILISDTPL